MLGSDADTDGVTISVPLAKLKRLRNTVSNWPSDRELASKKELCCFTGPLLYLCELVRVGKYFVRRMLNKIGLCPVSAWGAKFHVAHTSAMTSPRVHWGPGVLNRYTE